MDLFKVELIFGLIHEFENSIHELVFASRILIEFFFIQEAEIGLFLI